MHTEQIAAIDQEFDAARAAGAGVACAAGCTFCCHQRVAVLPHEAVAVLRHLREQVPASDAERIEQRVHGNAQRIDQMTAEEHRRANLACALLVDGRCSVYAARPLACASYHSMSRARCEHAFNHPAAMGTASNARPVLLALKEFCDGLIDSTRSDLQAAGGCATPGELHQQLRELMLAEKK